MALKLQSRTMPLAHVDKGLSLSKKRMEVTSCQMAYWPDTAYGLSPALPKQALPVVSNCEQLHSQPEFFFCHPPTHNMYPLPNPISVAKLQSLQVANKE